MPPEAGVSVGKRGFGLRLEARTETPRWLVYTTPLLALALTVLSGAGLFAVLGVDLGFELAGLSGGHPRLQPAAFEVLQQSLVLLPEPGEFTSSLGVERSQALYRQAERRDQQAGQRADQQGPQPVWAAEHQRAAERTGRAAQASQRSHSPAR